MKIDWSSQIAQIHQEWITTDLGLKDLAAKYGTTVSKLSFKFRQYGLPTKYETSRKSHRKKGTVTRQLLANMRDVKE